MIDADSVALVATRRWCVKRDPAASTTYVKTNKLGDLPGESLHRFIVGAPVGAYVDHINGNGLDNRRANLRLCSNRDNVTSKVNYVRKKRARGGFIGVQLQKNTGLWWASIHAGELLPTGARKRLSLGRFNTAEDAALAYDFAARMHFGEFASPNFPERHDMSPPEPVLMAFSTAVRGSAHGRAKLSEELVHLIRSSSDKATVLAGMIGVTPTTIGRVRARQAWIHVA